MRAGLVGGTGPAGRALAARLAASGVEVLIGSRSAARGEEVAAELCAKWPDAGLSLRGADYEEAAACEIVVLATPSRPRPRPSPHLAGRSRAASSSR